MPLSGSGTFAICKTPLVSVLVPVYKVEHFIARSIRSVLSQTYAPIELIICDDHSPDRSMEVAAAELSSVVREKMIVKRLQNNTNIGIEKTRKRLLSEATGKYIFWLDSDDYFSSDEVIAKAVDKMIEENLEVLFLDYTVAYNRMESYVLQQPPHGGKAIAVAIMENRLQAFLWSKVWERNFALSNLKAFDQGLTYMEDIYYNLTLLPYAQRVGYLPISSIHYVQYRKEAITKQYTQAYIDNFFRSIDAVAERLLPLADPAINRALNIARLNAKSAMMLGATYKLQKKLRAIHPEVDHYNTERKATWYHRFIFAMQRRAMTAPLGYVLARLFRIMRRLLV